MFQPKHVNQKWMTRFNRNEKLFNIDTGALQIVGANM